MKKIISTSIICLFLLVFHNAQAAPVLMPAPPKLAATAYVLLEAKTGKILVAHNEHERHAPASLTKLMTSYIADYEIAKGNIGLDDKVLVSEKAWRTPGSRMFIREGTQVKVSDLLQGIIVQSGNDASVAMAEHIAGSEGAFADLMNQHAKLLGMTQTHFANATGLPHKDHYTTAYDLSLLARAIVTHFPERYHIYAEKYFTYNNIRQPNRNRLLWRDNSVDGLKTGHTDEAGYCLVASAKRNGMRLISVVMGTHTDEARAQESQKLLSYGFRFYETVDLYKAKEVLNTAQVWSGKSDQLKLGTMEPVAVTIPRGQSKALKVTVDMDKTIKAPVAEGARYGTVHITLNDQPVADTPLVALESVDQAGLFKRIWDSVVLFFLSLLGG